MRYSVICSNMKYQALVSGAGHPLTYSGTSRLPMIVTIGFPAPRKKDPFFNYSSDSNLYNQ